MAGNRSFPGYPPRFKNVGADLESATPSVDHPVHKVITTATITTITPGFPTGGEFVGPLYLIAGSVFAWTTSGNIGAPPGTTLVANRSYGFIYEEDDATWYPFGQDS